LCEVARDGCGMVARRCFARCGARFRHTRAVKDEPRRRRRGGWRRRRPDAVPRPTQPPARPQRAARPEPPARAVARPVRRRPRQARSPDDVASGTPCVILLDCREGEPDRTGQPATFEGFFDFETGDPRRTGTGVPRLRVAGERLWGFEVWWRTDPQRVGMTEADREELEVSKKLLRGLVRDARRQRPLAARSSA
jgi:hypothetical protein